MVNGLTSISAHLHMRSSLSRRELKIRHEFKCSEADLNPSKLVQKIPLASVAFGTLDANYQK